MKNNITSKHRRFCQKVKSPAQRSVQAGAQEANSYHYYFEFSEAQRVVEMLTDPKGKYDAQRDCFVSTNSDSEEEIWPAELITALGGQQVKVYGIGAGAWIWDEVSS